MRHPSNGATIRPAERDRGCIFKDDFRSQANMVASGWTLFNTPTFDARGMILNGTNQRAEIPIQGLLNSTEITTHLELYPGFAYDDGLAHYMLDAETGGNPRFFIRKAADSELRIDCGNTTTVASVTGGNYGTYWKPNERNILSLSAVSGTNVIMLNGHQLTNAAAGAAWDPRVYDTFTVGSTYFGGSYFPGAVSRLYIGHHTSDLAEHTAVYENTMWSYQNRAVVDLQFRTADYDIGNVRTLDSSGNGNHATLGDGLGTGEPTQGAGRMIFDGVDDYLSGIADPTGTFTILTTQAATGGGWEVYADNDLTRWTPIFTTGGFTGEVADIKVVGETLNTTQVLDYTSNALRRLGAEA